MNNKQDACIKRDNSLCTYLNSNTAAFTGDVALVALATKTHSDYALTVIAASAAEADNTGYSLEKVQSKNNACVMTSDLCARSQVKLDLEGNIIVSKSLNSTVSYYSDSTDVIAASRMQNAHDVMSEHILLISPDYVTVAQLATLQTKITTFKDLSGTTTSVNTTNTVKTKALKKAVKVGAANVLNIKKLAKKYQLTNPTFYDGLKKVCKIPAVTVRHTPVNIAVTEAATGLPLANVTATLSKTTELGVSTDAGIIHFTNVSAGTAIATCMLEGYITGIKNVKIKRGKTNDFTFALESGVMTTEMEAAISSKINAFNVAEAANKAKKVAKAKARKEAKETKKSS